MRRDDRLFSFVVLAVLLMVLGCQPAADPEAQEPPAGPAPVEIEQPTLETYADSVAMRVYEASGGPAAWSALPYLRFNFAVSVEGTRRRTIQHLWDRGTGDYRVEMRGPGGEPYIILFNINTRQGQAYWGDTPLDSTDTAEKIAEAYQRFINDTYWLLVPFKLFDPGVHRAYVADSSHAEADVLHLSFGDVGLTPGDQYWLYVDKESGRLTQWSYVLQGSEGQPPRSFVWDEYEEHVTPAGSLFFAARKRAVGRPNAIYTDAIRTPLEVPEGIFSDPDIRLDEAGQ